MARNAPIDPARPRRATIGDVAELAGVARPTVSAILNQRADCYASQKTRERVVAAAERLGYRASPMARAMMGKATQTLGLVVGGFDVEVTAIKIAAFEAAGRAQGKMTIVACAHNQPALEDQAVRWLLERYVDAIGLFPCESGPHAEARRLAASGFPVVAFDALGRLGDAADDAAADYISGGALAIEHLLKSGRRRIGLLHSVPPCFVNERKIEGMERALHARGQRLVFRSALNMPVQGEQHWKTDEFAQIGDVLAREARRVDAIVCIGDALALAAMQHAAAIGLRVPDDLAVTGYDGSTMARHSIVPLTTVTHPPDEIGRLAFELLQQRLTGARGSNSPRQLLIAPQLLPRASTLPKSPLPPSPGTPGEGRGGSHDPNQPQHPPINQASKTPSLTLTRSTGKGKMPMRPTPTPRRKKP